jgi:hypothetical protein
MPDCVVHPAMIANKKIPNIANFMVDINVLKFFKDFAKL